MDEYYYDDFELNDDPFDEPPDDEFNFYPNFLKNPTDELDQTPNENEFFYQNTITNKEPSSISYQIPQSNHEISSNKRQPLQEIQSNQRLNNKSASPYFLASSADFYDFNNNEQSTTPTKQQQDPIQNTQSNIIQKHNEINSLVNVSDKLKNLVPVTELRNIQFI